MATIIVHDPSRNSGDDVTLTVVARTDADVPRMVFFIDGSVAVRQSFELPITRWQQPSGN